MALFIIFIIFVMSVWVALTVYDIYSKPEKANKKLKSSFKTSPSKIEPTSAFTALPREKLWNSQVFQAIEWRRFEAVCQRWFGHAGFRTESQAHGADGGVDIWLYKGETKKPAAVVQCKHWKNRAVGVKELREFFGVMASQNINRGIFVTSSTFTLDAQDFAKATGITLVDGLTLLHQIAKLTVAQKKVLLDTAFEGEYWRPTCASCGVKLVERKARSSAFWGCTNFPRCKTKIWSSR